MSHPLRIDHGPRNNEFDVPHAAPSDIEAEQRRQSEIARIRNEIMEIAREVAELRRCEYDGRVRDAMPNPGGRPTPQRPAGSEPNKRPAQAPDIRAAEPRHQPQEPPPLPPAGRRHQLVERAHRHSRTGNADPATKAAPARAERSPLTIHDEVRRFAPAKPKPQPKRDDTLRWSIAVKAALLTGVMLTGTGLITLALWQKMPWPVHDRQKLTIAETTASVSAAKPAAPSQWLLPSSVDPAPAYPFEMPDTYGVYAVSDGHLIPLEPLPIRVPDARVEFSSPVSKPAPAPIANGNLQFAVYHRDLATSVPEGASVRIAAKVMQATTFVNGKSKPVPVADTWVVRGGAIDFRIAPVAANKEMILIRPADPALTLSPGRYVLMFRNQAYDFSVAGTVSDTAQCLERSELDDKYVYSECRELPASAKL